MEHGWRVATTRILDPALSKSPAFAAPQVLNYARSLLDHGFPPGVLMIDTNWAIYYGSPQFDQSRFPDPARMVSDLHDLGFKASPPLCPCGTAQPPLQPGSAIQ